MNILLVDDKSFVMKKYAKKIASELGSNFQITVVSDIMKSEDEENFRIVNINEITVTSSIEEFQSKYPFSINKLLVTDRNFTNYSTFSNIYKYSNYNKNLIDNEILKWINAYDYLLKNDIDIVYTGLADNFKFNMAWKIAEFYNKSFFIPYHLYWWNNAILIADRYNQTSSKIDENYYKFYNHNFTKNEKEYLTKLFFAKKITTVFTDNNIYPLKKRLLGILKKQNSYEKISIKNLVLRKIYYYYSKFIKNVYINSKYHHVQNNIQSDQFVIYPLHVTPEASILGSDPELADQFCLIKNIALNLPYGVTLYVKEHPDQLYGYDINHNFYNKLLSINNIRLIHKNENVYKIIEHKNCLGVAVLNGTLGLETVFKFRKPVFVFGSADYSVADCFIKPDNWDDFFHKVQLIQKNKFVFNEQAMWSILKAFDESIISDNDYDINKYNTWEDWGMDTTLVVKFLTNLPKLNLP